jgi:hypothetical protein
MCQRPGGRALSDSPIRTVCPAKATLRRGNLVASASGRLSGGVPPTPSSRWDAGATLHLSGHGIEHAHVPILQVGEPVIVRHPLAAVGLTRNLPDQHAWTAARPQIKLR